jgi:hypothetical protein
MAAADTASCSAEPLSSSLPTLVLLLPCQTCARQAADAAAMRQTMATFSIGAPLLRSTIASTASLHLQTKMSQKLQYWAQNKTLEYCTKFENLEQNNQDVDQNYISNTCTVLKLKTLIIKTLIMVLRTKPYTKWYTINNANIVHQIEQN